MHRTTIKTLRALVATLNDVTGNPRDAYRQIERDITGAHITAIPGVYILDCAYGGYRLAQIDRQVKTLGVDGLLP